MSTFLPKEVINSLADAKRETKRRETKHRVKFNGKMYPLNRFWDSGFSLDLEYAPNMRGLVDVFEGQNHIKRCLVVASEQSDVEMTYEYKLMTEVSAQAPVDFVKPVTSPVALLEQSTADPRKLL